VFIKLEKTEYPLVAHLFTPLAHNLSIASVIDGICKGWIYCDDPVEPSSAFMGTFEGYFLGGYAGNNAFNSGVGERVQQMVKGDTVRPNSRYLEFEFTDPEWLHQLDTIFQGREPLTYFRRHYRCSGLALTNWRDKVPRGFKVQFVDRELLHNKVVELEDRRDSGFHPFEWALAFGSIDNYLKYGFGSAVMDGDCMVSWSMSDCVTGNHAEIGIYTMPEYRRRGLASIAAAAAVENCLKQDIETVGWHCNDGNTASQRTAEKVGFEHINTFERHYILRPEWRHYGELGLRDFQNGDFDDSVGKFHLVFEQTNEAENYVYHLAAVAAAKIGQFDQSLIWLREAAQRGWANLSYTNSRPEFDSLKESSEWGSIIAKMAENQQGFE
jgi:GNAT superfamily N-acetyltransferase